LTQPTRTIGEESTWWLEKRGDAVPRTSKSVVVVPCLAMARPLPSKLFVTKPLLEVPLIKSYKYC